MGATTRGDNAVRRPVALLQPRASRCGYACRQREFRRSIGREAPVHGSSVVQWRKEGAFRPWRACAYAVYGIVFFTVYSSHAEEKREGGGMVNAQEAVTPHVVTYHNQTMMASTWRCMSPVPGRARLRVRGPSLDACPGSARLVW